VAIDYSFIHEIASPYFSPDGGRSARREKILDEYAIFRERGFFAMPITLLAYFRVRRLALHTSRSYGYGFRSRAAPPSAILLRNAD
jgi:hypothetical protein